MEPYGLYRFVLPDTSPDRYISFLRALNVHEDGEDTGDWHQMATWFTDNRMDKRPAASVVGRGCGVDTTPALGTSGVRDMGKVLFEREIIDIPGQVWVADHMRAIADIVYVDSAEGRDRRHASHRQINSWLHTEEQIAKLRKDFLRPLGDIVPSEHKPAHERFVAELEWD